MSDQLKHIEIKPKKGFSNVLFGFSMSEVEKHLGAADEIDQTEEEEGTKTTIWHYWKKGYSLFFNSESNDIFTCIEIENKEAVLWGEKVFELTEEQLIQLFTRMGYRSCETELYEWGEKRISFDDALVDCYFEEDKLAVVNYGIYIDDNKVLILPN